MHSTRTLVIVAVAAVLALLAFVLWISGDDDGVAIERAGDDSAAAVDAATDGAVELADGRATRDDGVAATNSPDAVHAPSDEPGSARRDVGGTRTWRELVRPIAARGRVPLTDFDVAVFGVDGSRRDFAAGEQVPAGVPASDALVCLFAEGLCPRFVRGERLAPDAPAEERDAIMVPRASLTITSDTTSPWFVRPRRLSVAPVGRDVTRSGGLFASNGETPLAELAEDLRALIADDSGGDRRVELLERARAHADYDAVTELGGVDGWPDPFVPFSLWVLADSVEFPAEFDPVAPNRGLRLSSSGDGISYFDVQRVHAVDGVVSAPHALVELRLPTDAHNVVELLFAPFGSITGRFPPASSAWLVQTTFEQRADGEVVTSSITQSTDVADDGSFTREFLPPGSYEVMGAWNVDARTRLLSSVEIELAPGEHRDLGRFVVDGTRSLVLRPEFVAVGPDGTLAPVAQEELDGARLHLGFASQDHFTLQGLDMILNWSRFDCTTQPIRVDGIPDGSWSIDVERLDSGSTGWTLVETAGGVGVTMPGRFDVPLTVLLNRGETIAVRLDLPDGALAPGTRLLTSTWAAGRAAGSTSSFRWVDGPDGDDGWPAANVPAFQGRNRVFGRAWVPESNDASSAFATDGVTWVGIAEVDVESGGSAEAAIALQRAASVIVRVDDLPAEVVAANAWSIAPLDGGRSRLGSEGTTTVDGVETTRLVYDELLPATVYRFGETDVTFTTGGPGTTLDVTW